MKTSKSTTQKKSSPIKSISLMGYSNTDMRKYEIDSAMNTLKKADEIRSNAKMMSDIKKAANDLQKIVNRK
jgi:hypothetical protein